MKLLKILLIAFLIGLVSACTPKADDDAKYVGHWVIKDNPNARTVAIDITSEGNGNYLFVPYWKDQLFGTKAVTKQKGVTANVKDGTLLLEGIEPVIIKDGGVLFAQRNEYTRQ